MRILDRLRALRRRRPSRIGVRLFAFNLLVLFVPIAGMLYLDVYEDRLLETQERGMVQQARVAAAALSATGTLDETLATAVLRALGDHGEARIKIFARRRPAAGGLRPIRSPGSTTPDGVLQVLGDRRSPPASALSSGRRVRACQDLADGGATAMVRKCEDAADLQRGCGGRSG